MSLCKIDQSFRYDNPNSTCGKKRERQQRYKRILLHLPGYQAENRSGLGHLITYKAIRSQKVKQTCKKSG